MDASLVVAPQLQRRGIGRALMAAVLDAHESKGLTVQTGAKNAPALALVSVARFRGASALVCRARATRVGQVTPRATARPGLRNAAQPSTVSLRLFLLVGAGSIAINHLGGLTR